MWKISARVAAAAAATAIGVLAALGSFPTPAAAHEELVSSTAEADEVLTTAPTEVSLTFSAVLNPSATELAVVDSATRSVLDGSPRIDDATVRQDLKPGLPSGEYRVSYRLISTDGHPVSGTWSFTVQTDVAAPSAAGSSPQPSAVDALPEAPEVASREAAASGGVSRWWIVGGAAVIALCVAVGSVLVWRRRSRTQTGE